MTSNHHAPYVLGFTHATMAGTEGCDTVRWSESLKAGLSSDWGLQLGPMKSESLVIADQQRCGEYVLGPCTHRPSRHESRQHPKPVALPFGGSGRRWGWRLGRSRNKVAVPEGAAGSPPFWGCARSCGMCCFVWGVSLFLMEVLHCCVRHAVGPLGLPFCVCAVCVWVWCRCGGWELYSGREHLVLLFFCF